MRRSKDPEGASEAGCIARVLIGSGAAYRRCARWQSECTAARQTAACAPFPVACSPAGGPAGVAPAGQHGPAATGGRLRPRLPGPRPRRQPPAARLRLYASWGRCPRGRQAGLRPQADHPWGARATSLVLQMRGIHACRWVAAEAQAQAPAVPLSTELHTLDVRAARPPPSVPASPGGAADLCRPRASTSQRRVSRRRAPGRAGGRLYFEPDAKAGRRQARPLHRRAGALPSPGAHAA